MLTRLERVAEVPMIRIGGALVVLLLASARSRSSPTRRPSPRRPLHELTVEQMQDFLKNAKVIRTRTTSKGVTAPKRLTLSDGVITHDAVFQAIDERKMVANLGGGGRQATTELNFVDSYRYNIARLRAGRAARPRPHDAGLRRAALERRRSDRSAGSCRR